MNCKFQLSFSEVISLPQDDRFWVDFFTAAKSWGLILYNQDWQDYQYVYMRFMQIEL